MAFTWIELVRVVHVLGAVVWAGGAIFALVIVGPGVRAAGEAGQKFMQAVGRRGGPARLMGPAGITTIVTGVLLYWQYEYWREPFANAASALLTLGALLGLTVFAVGYAVGLPMQKRLAAMGAQVGPTGPTPEQKDAMQELGARVGRFGIAFSWVLVAALVLMVGRTLAG